MFLITFNSAAKNIQKPNNIVVEKSARKMYLKYNDKILYKYNISLGSDPQGAKSKEGDGKTPEGTYIISAHNPQSAYPLSLRISYPNTEDIKRAKEQNVSAGGDIMIHGFPNKAPAFIFQFIHKYTDWTAGCIAVTNKEIEQI